MSLLFSLIAHLLVTLARLAKPGGLGAVVAESLAVKHQLLILKRARRRAPYLTSWDRLALGVCTLLVSPKRLSKMAVILKPSTLLYFHRALVKRKYRLLYSPRNRRRPGPKGSSRELIDTVVEMKRRNPRFGCRKIAEQIVLAPSFRRNIDDPARALGAEDRQEYSEDPLHTEKVGFENIFKFGRIEFLNRSHQSVTSVIDDDVNLTETSNGRLRGAADGCTIGHVHRNRKNALRVSESFLRVFRVSNRCDHTISLFKHCLRDRQT